MTASVTDSIFIDFARQKLLNALVFFIKNTRNCGKTKIFKLLFYLDFIHFKQTAKPVTGLIYNAFPWGPVPADLFNEFEKPPADLQKFLFIPKIAPGEFCHLRIKKGVKFDPLYFSKRELRIMNQVAEIFYEAIAEDMTNVTHLPNDPWDKTIKSKGEKAEIDYMLSFDNTEQSLSRERAQEILDEMKEVRSLFTQ
ncbi:MAG: type II toxin-antitoxin system antitoxin SocA domain-containing protein [Thermodesulfobacteriota bacterium]